MRASRVAMTMLEELGDREMVGSTPMSVGRIPSLHMCMWCVWTEGRTAYPADMLGLGEKR